ncbi:MAG TPA: hypothetical protein VFO35_09870 [Steroidobacteraceae bacterium]|nr:hypothetical protein [Steroidobacteraceae bacterium]
MRRRNSLIVVGVAAAAAIVWFVRPAERPQPAQSSVDATQREPTQSPAPARAPRPAVPQIERPQSRPTGDPRVQEFQQREQFQQEVREFFARAPALSPEERAARAKEIARAITHYEAKGEIAAAEALTLRSGLIRETVQDPVEQIVAMRGLQQHYQQQGERKQAEWEARPNPELELYKAREREIVNEVMAMTTIPDGLTRDEYLRRRLQSAREQLDN